MKRQIELPAPRLQVDFAFLLKKLRATCLQNALLQTVGGMNIADIDRQLVQYVGGDDLAAAARYGLRGELLFAVPLVLEKNPFLLGYYRLLTGYSQKEFYGKEFGLSPFKSMETRGVMAKNAVEDMPLLCRALCQSASLLLNGVKSLDPDKNLLDDLTLLTLGPQLRGGVNNRRGTAGIIQLFEIIRGIVAHSISDVRNNVMEVTSATGRKVLIEFAPDPDIIIREEMSSDNFRNIVAIEVKSGTDISNIHNRIGEAEKSHQKARKRGFTECWTVINVNRFDLDKAKAESPSTDRFYSLQALQLGDGEEFEDFRRRIVSLTAIVSG